MLDLCLLYFYFNEIFTSAKEKGEIGEIIISLPEDCNEKEIIQFYLYNTFKRIGYHNNISFVSRPIEYLAFMSIMDNKKKTNENYIIVETDFPKEAETQNAPEFSTACLPSLTFFLRSSYFSFSGNSLIIVAPKTSTAPIPL